MRPAEHKLSKYITESGKTQADICREMGVNHSTLWLWCKGKRRISVKNLMKLSEVLGRDLSELLDGRPVELVLEIKCDVYHDALGYRVIAKGQEITDLITEDSAKYVKGMFTYE